MSKKEEILLNTLNDELKMNGIHWHSFTIQARPQLHFDFYRQMKPEYTISVSQLPTTCRLTKHLRDSEPRDDELNIDYGKCLQKG